MALAKIKEIYVYTNSAADQVGTHELHAWFDHSGIEHVKLNYNDISILADVIDPLNTWWRKDENGDVQPPLTAFPFVVYTEVHTDEESYNEPKKYIAGKDKIIAELPSLYALGR
jgi:hypothetical protein